MVYLKLLGGAVLEDERTDVSAIASRRHPMALLALLASTSSRTLSRGKLAGMLWPDSPEKIARNRLNTYVHRMRRTLGDDALLSVGDDLRLDEKSVPCDVSRFRRALHDENHDAAVALYEGPFLDGFRLNGSPEFEKWVDGEQDRLRRGYHAALEALARRAEDVDGPEVAVHWWHERAREDPFDSRVTRRLMEALVASGNRAAALKHAAEHGRLMEEEFGSGPGQQVLELVRMLQAEMEGESTARGVGAMSPLPSMVPDPRSIAILPFGELGGSEQAAHFAVGLHHDLLTRLARVRALTVISRTSVLRYRDTDLPIARIARELGVGTVLEGAVQQAGNRLRLNVQLIDASGDHQRWARTFDRELSAETLFDIQSELAEEITKSLQAALTPSEREQVSGPPTHDLDAYLLYSQGRAHLAQRTERATRKATRYFQRAIDNDPEYALAWTGFAEALMLQEYYGYTTPTNFRHSLEAARRAVALNPELAEANGSLGAVHAARQEGPAAIDALRKAVELQPGFAEAHTWLGWIHMITGSAAKALEPALRAAELDPLAPYTRVYLGEIYLANGREKQALEEARAARTLQPEYGVPYFIEGMSLCQLGAFSEAAFTLEEALALVSPGGTPSRMEVAAALALACVASGNGSKARDLLAEIVQEDDSFSIGLVHAAFGEHDEALDVFERVGRWGLTSTPVIRYFLPEVLGPIRKSPRYSAILRKVDKSWGIL